ncbi:hypothetical protein H2200_000900 [Cladophialophora chaetospira]|uniref:Heterokaryon incompatibility domain-containing protein n=1 Tax=Cladophialophora chaetospira TaxID=386627 RepID=A0AA38XPE4_9EURO|nr:hypothetical protein H2200_000900 [Cladophialophora chaetospira]
MGFVFSGAQQVIGWLATSNTPTLATPGSVQSDPNILGARILADVIATDQAAYPAWSTEDAVLGALTRLVQHEFWERLWIVQELNLAREALLYWQGQVISFHSLRRTLSHLFYPPKPGIHPLRAAISQSSREWDFQGLAIHSFLSEPDTERLDWSPDGRGFKDDLLDLVLKYKRHRCSLLHDRVYALRAMASDGHLLEPSYEKGAVKLLWSVLSVKAKGVNFPDLAHTKALGNYLDIHGHLMMEAVWYQPKFDSRGWLESFKAVYLGDKLNVNLCSECLSELHFRGLYGREDSPGDLIGIPELDIYFWMDHANARGTMQAMTGVMVLRLDTSSSSPGHKEIHFLGHDRVRSERLSLDFRLQGHKGEYLGDDPHLEVVDWKELHALLRMIWMGEREPLRCQRYKMVS